MKPSRRSDPAPAAPRSKSGHAPADPPESTAASGGLRTQALNDEITRVARDLWERYGRPEGRDEAIWLEAERQVLGADAEVARVPDGPVSASALREANAAPLERNRGARAPKPPAPRED